MRRILARPGTVLPVWGLARTGAFCLLPLIAAIPAGAVPLEEAVRAALQTNPDVGIVAEGKRAVEYELEQARGGFLPQVDVTTAGGFQITKDNTTRGARTNGTEDKPYERLPTWEAGVTLSQMIFDGFATASEVERQESRVVSASRRVRETSELIGLDAIEAYLESLRQRELVTLAEDNVDAHKNTLQLVEAKAAGGAATVADIEQAQSRLAAAEATLTDAVARLRDADATYRRVVGERPDSLERPAAPEWGLPSSLDKAIRLAIENNPTVAVAKADVDTAVSEFRSTKSGFLPSVNFEMSANANRNQEGTRGGDYDATARVVMSYNLFRGGQDINSRHEFVARIGEARQRYNRALRLTEEEMRLSWNALLSARERVAAQRREVEANDRVRLTYRQQFDLGSRSLLELLDAENELFLATGNLITTEFLELFSVFRILSTGGILLATLDVEPVRDARTEFDPVDPVQVDLTPSLTGVEAGTGGGFLDPGAEEDGDVLDPGALLDPSAPLDDGPVLDPGAVLEGVEEEEPESQLLVPEAPAAAELPDLPEEDIGEDSLDNLLLDEDAVDPNAPVLDPEAELNSSAVMPYGISPVRRVAPGQATPRARPQAPAKPVVKRRETVEVEVLPYGFFDQAEN